MTIVLKDGTGTGNTAKIDNKNRIRAFSTVETGGTEASFSGGLYNVNTGTISLTSSNISALAYMKNTDSVPWIFNRVFYNAGPSTGGTGDFLADVIANPTSGTLISAGVENTPQNLNFGSSEVLTGISLKGTEGSTLTDGDVRVSTIIPAAGTRVLIAFDSIILEPGSSIGVSITPQTGNTAMNIQVGFNLYRFVV